MINRTFAEVEAKAFYVNNKNLFDAKFVYIFDVDNGKVKWE
jgi:outer membrane protein assembly factor BamB